MVYRHVTLAGVALAALLWSSSNAQAQCSGQPGANTICAGPASGGPGLPNFRASVIGDLPATVGTVKSVSATVPLSLLTIGGSPITATGTLAFGLASTTADTYWGTKVAGTPGYLNFPSCSGTNQALNYTSGTGFGCITPAGSGGNPGGGSGQIQWNNGGVFGGFTASGDATITPSTGNVNVTGTGGTSFAASATTNALNASNINAGTLAAARGGAGTVTGALRGNGAGVVTQAACADLSNASNGCSTATGTSGASIPLLNGNNTWSGTNNFTGGFSSNGNTMNFPAVAGANLTYTLLSGTIALATAAIPSGSCAGAVSSTVTGLLTTDVVIVNFNSDPTGVVGYQPSTAGMLTIIPYPTAGFLNVKVCNNTQSSITPGAITLNWRVVK